MRKYQIYALLQFDSESSGNAAVGVEFNVYNAGGGLATIYAQNGASPISQASPLVTDSNGRYEFYAANGRYSILFTDETIASQNDLTDVSIYEYGSAGARDVATTAEAIAGTSNKLPDTIGVKAAVTQIGKDLFVENDTKNIQNLLTLPNNASFSFGFGGAHSEAAEGDNPFPLLNGAFSLTNTGSAFGNNTYVSQIAIKYSGSRAGQEIKIRGIAENAGDDCWVELWHDYNLGHAQNLSGVTIAPNVTISGANLNPAKVGTWRNVSGNDILNNGYGLWGRVL